jgi:hypothetical protein
MSHDDIPKAFGMFKPVGHVLVSFASDEAATAAAQAFADAGFPAEDIHQMASADVVEQASKDVHDAGFLASLGQELNLVRAHLELARRGHGFVAVRAPDDAAAARIADIARASGADRAQRYGHFLIEELLEPGTGEQQVAESPSRGLDAQTRSGREAG